MPDFGSYTPITSTQMSTASSLIVLDISDTDVDHPAGKPKLITQAEVTTFLFST